MAPRSQIDDQQCEWRCRIDGQEIGPISLKQLRRLAILGTLMTTDEVQCPGTQAWALAGSLPELRIHLGNDQVASAVRGTGPSRRPFSWQMITDEGGGKVQPPWPCDLLATMGFLCSTVGLVTAGVAAPLGLVFSSLALLLAWRRNALGRVEFGFIAALYALNPRALPKAALAGVAIGLLGCAETLYFLLGLSLISLSAYFIATRALGCFLWIRLLRHSNHSFAIVSVIFSIGLGYMSFLSALRVYEVNKWQFARNSNTFEALQQYVTDYPQGRFIEDVRQRQAALLVDPAPYRVAVERGTAEAIRDFLKNYPGHVQTTEAMQALARIDEENSWNTAAGINTIRALLEHVARYPKGRFEKEGEARCAILRKDESSYVKASQEGTLQAFAQFLRDYPGHLNEPEARSIHDRLLEETVWTQAKTIRALQDYLKSYPKGRFATDSAAKIALLKEDDTIFWDALKMASEVGLSQFLLEFPGHVREPATTRLLAVVKDINGAADTGRSESFRGPVYPLQTSSWDEAHTISFHSSAESVVGYYDTTFTRQPNPNDPAIQITTRIVFVDKESPDRIRVVTCVASPATNIERTYKGGTLLRTRKVGCATTIDGVRTEQESDLNELQRLAIEEVTLTNQRVEVTSITPLEAPNGDLQDNTHASSASVSDSTVERATLSATRTWHNTEGRAVVASFAGYRDGSVLLHATGGRDQWIPIRSLSPVDRQFVLSNVRGPDEIDARTMGSRLELRNWVDVTGNSLKAAFVSLQNERVELLKENGELAVVPLARFSNYDQDFVRSMPPNDQPSQP
jgi:outer membrane protein assembly factor BamD (BamD/ComL family)